MEFKKSTMTDMKGIMEILRDAQDYLKENKIPQWDKDYPNEKIIKKDIEDGNSYILLKNGDIVGTLAASFDGERTYNTIYEGEWIEEDNDYVVVHRIAVDKDSKGKELAIRMLDEIEKIARNKDVNSIRIDTHKKNDSMLNLIEKHGFRYCGIIYLDDGEERVAYEKIINN